jgi:hypothetical protein
MPSDGLAAFRAEVVADRALQRSLLEHPGDATFPAFVASLARAHGHEVEVAEVERALVDARRTWLERWV